jgi:hypothetical protein
VGVGWIEFTLNTDIRKLLNYASRSNMKFSGDIPRITTNLHTPAIQDYISELFIYTNIVEFSYINNIKAPILRIVPVGNREKNHELVSEIFADKNFINLANDKISNIHILILDENGEEVRFTRDTTIVLVFKRTPL